MHTNQANSQSIKSPANILRVILVDDQKFVQHKLQQMLSSEIDLKIVGIANDGETAIALVETLEPDVVLIDIEMPKMNGIEATKIIAERFPNCKILILSSYEHQEYVQKIIVAGADGYILKTSSAKDLVTAIHSVCNGYAHFGSQLFKKIQLAQNVEEISGVESSKPLVSHDYLSISQPSSPQQLASRQAEELLPPVSKWLTWGGISVVAIIALAIPATAIFQYKTVVKAQAIARPVEELHLVQAAVEGQVSQILVKKGQVIQKGEAIATLDLSRFQTKQNQLESGIKQQKLQLGQLQAQIIGLRSQITAETERNQSEIAAARSELAGSQRNYQDKNTEVTTQVEESQAQVKAVAASLNAAQAKHHRYQSVAKAGAIGKNQLAEAELEVKQQEQELEAAKAKLTRAISALNPSTSEMETYQQRIEQAKKSGRATIASLNRETEALVQQRIEIDRQLEQDMEELNQVNKELSKTQITATATGTIFQLGVNNQGQTVQPGQEIAQIIPENFQIEMKAAVSPQDISKLKVGQGVQMRVSACPYPDYGTLEGRVSQIAQDTSKPPSQTENDLQVQKTATFYEVAIAPNSDTFGRQKHQCSLQLGMESQVDIISRTETMLQFILRKARLTTNL
jgi:HlyD family type I secretion membrane fusion protein